MTDKLVWIENHKQHIELLDKLKFKTSYFYIFAGYPFNDGHRDSILEYCCSNLKLIDKIQSKGLFEGKSEEAEYYQYIFEIVDYTQRESFLIFSHHLKPFFIGNAFLTTMNHMRTDATSVLMTLPLQTKTKMCFATQLHTKR